MLENVAVISTPNQEAAIFVAIVRFQEEVTEATIEALIAEDQSKMYAAKATGDVTKIHRIEQITVTGRPAIIVDVERGPRGRGYSVTIFSGKTGVQIQCIVQNLQRFAAYEPDFDHVFDTFTMTP